MSDRVDWKDCRISEQEEREFAAKFRDEFKSFDFTL
jgi:hypothetical protein